MNTIKRTSFLLIVLLPLILNFRAAAEIVNEGPIYSSGFINITVESNINRIFFNYNIKGNCLSDSGSSSLFPDDSSSLTRIVVPVKEFKCKNQYAYKDFLTLLKADMFPNLEIDFPVNTDIVYISDDSILLRGVIISVAGSFKKYDINCKIDSRIKNSRVLLGTTRINLTDLDIEPPVKSFGLIKVRNEIIINFGFCLSDIR